MHFKLQMSVHFTPKHFSMHVMNNTEYLFVSRENLPNVKCTNVRATTDEF